MMGSDLLTAGKPALDGKPSGPGQKAALDGKDQK